MLERKQQLNPDPARLCSRKPGNFAALQKEQQERNRIEKHLPRIESQLMTLLIEWKRSNK